jgi:hypothetical protein
MTATGATRGACSRFEKRAPLSAWAACGRNLRRPMPLSSRARSWADLGLLLAGLLPPAVACLTPPPEHVRQRLPRSDCSQRAWSCSLSAGKFRPYPFDQQSGGGSSSPTRVVLSLLSVRRCIKCFAEAQHGRAYFNSLRCCSQEQSRSSILSLGPKYVPKWKLEGDLAAAKRIGFMWTRQQEAEVVRRVVDAVNIHRAPLDADEADVFRLSSQLIRTRFADAANVLESAAERFYTVNRTVPRPLSEVATSGLVCDVARLRQMLENQLRGISQW